MNMSHRSIALLTVINLLASSSAWSQAPARLVRDANRRPGDFKAKIQWVAPVGDKVVFSMDTLATGQEVWVTDGGRRRTRLLKDLLPGPGSSYPGIPVPFGSKLAFSAINENSSGELWVADGTSGGTAKVYQHAESVAYGSVFPAAGTTRGIFFESNDWELNDPYELLFSDGTAEGTRVLNPFDGDSRKHFSWTYSHCSFGEWCFFSANDYEIWRSDGTDTGTIRLPAPDDGWVSQVAVAGKRLLAHTSEDGLKSHLWTRPVTGGEWEELILPDPNSHLSDLLPYDLQLDRIFVTAWAESGLDLVAIDGSTKDSRRVPLVHDGEESEVSSVLTEWNGSLYVFAFGAGDEQEIWRTDGTHEGTQRLVSFPPGTAWVHHQDVCAAGGYLHFRRIWPGQLSELWRTRGDAASTERVRGIPGSVTAYNYGPTLAAAGRWMFFPAHQGTGDEGLWRTPVGAGGALPLTRPEKSTGSGVAGGFEMLGGRLLAFIDAGSGPELWNMAPNGRRARAIWVPQAPVGQYGWLDFEAVIGDLAVFSFNDGNGAHELLSTDGSARGTRLLARNEIPLGNGDPHDFVKVGNTWFYSLVNHTDPSAGGLWKTDGTPSGTSRIVAADGSVPRPDKGEMVAFQSELWFLATGDDGRTGLWKSDGTAAGTILVKDTWHGQADEKAMRLSVVGGELRFSVNLSRSQVLWKSDGTAGGTLRLPYGSFNRWSVSPAFDLGGVAIFQARRGIYYPAPEYHNQWWRDDVDNVSLVRDGVIYQHLYGWSEGLDLAIVAGSNLFYVGLDQDSFEGLWVTDGTSAGSLRVKAISQPRNFTPVGDSIYFTAFSPQYGSELWRSDGSEAGTVLVADIDPGPAGSDPRGLKIRDGKLYFHAQRRDIGRELYVLDLPELEEP